MTPNQQGAFCKVCSKTVVDFSVKSDAEVQKFLSENQEQKICGRFKVNQLERPTQDEIPRLKIEKPMFEFPSFLMPIITPFRACAMSLMIFASAALMSCGNSDTGGGGNDEHLAGAVAIVDSVETTLEPPKMLGEIAPVQNDSTCIIDDDVKVGKIKVIDNTDSLKTDSTETIQGEIEPRIKMGMLKRVDPEEKDYKKGEVKAEN